MKRSPPSPGRPGAGPGPGRPGADPGPGRPGPGLARRRFLAGSGAGLLGGPGLLGGSGLLPGCAGGDTDTGARTPGSIDHIVLCMMENRSFDHYFGGFTAEEGRADFDAMQASFSNPGPDGAPVYANPGHGRCLTPDPPHGWDAMRSMLVGGNQGFVRAYTDRYGTGFDYAQVLSYLSRAQAPVSYAMAEGYAVSNRWFSSVCGPTWPNRLYAHGAQSQGFRANDLPDGSFFTMRTIWDQLDEAGIDWGYYFTDLPMIALFGRFGDRLATIEQFFVDAAAGLLPPVVMVEPGAGLNDDHPPHHPMLGQLFIGSLHNALAASPLWDRCLFALAYDEAGGFYDHVAPPVLPDDLAAEGFGQAGFRVPAFAAGPYVRRGHVSTVQRDHTSWLRHIQRAHGLGTLTARDAAADDLSELLDLDRLARGEALPPEDLPVIPLTREEIEDQCDDRARPTGQPELQAALAHLGLSHLDLTPELGRISRFLIDKAVELGVCTAI